MQAGRHAGCMTRRQASREPSQHVAFVTSRLRDWLQPPNKRSASREKELAEYYRDIDVSIIQTRLAPGLLHLLLAGRPDLGRLFSFWTRSMKTVKEWT